jgi:uncharacterized protein YraI
MLRRSLLVVLILGIVLGGQVLVTAQDDEPDGWATVHLRLRAGPGTDYATIGALTPDTGLNFEGRDENAVWLLGVTEDGRRGWVARQYVLLREGLRPLELPISDTIIDTGVPVGPDVIAPPDVSPGLSEVADGSTVTILNLRAGPGTTYAVLGVLPSGTRLVFEARNVEATWLLGTTLDGAEQGWVSAGYLRFREGFNLALLPVSDASVERAEPGDETTPAETVQGDGWTLYPLRLRAGPGTNYTTLTILSASTGLIFEGRNESITWLLGETTDGLFRGWVSSAHLRYRETFDGLTLPVSDEVIELPPGVPVP